MRRFIPGLAAVAVLALSLSPGLADARAGGGSSFGSRGSRTYSAPAPTATAPSYSAPMERSYTPRVAPNTAPGYAPTPGLNPGFAPRPGAFTSGLLGGLIGAGIGGMLFGHGMFGGITGIGSFFGFLLQIALVFFVARWLWRSFARRGPAFAGPGLSNARQGAGLGGLGSMFRTGQPQSGPGGSVGGGTPAVAITGTDFAAFDQTLKAVQAAWSAGDLPRMSTLATPEMVGYFNEQLGDYSSRGLHNTVTDVALQKGDLSEGWAENGREYATVAMRFTMLDVTRDSIGRVVDGSATEHQTATELWTFMRAGGGRWVLSAIQQGR